MINQAKQFAYICKSCSRRDAISAICFDSNDLFSSADFVYFQMDHPSMSGLDMLNSPHNGDSISSSSMSSLPMSAGDPGHPGSQLGHPAGMYGHTTSMMSPHSSIGHHHHPHHPQAPHVALPDTDTDPRSAELYAWSVTKPFATHNSSCFFFKIF